MSFFKAIKGMAAAAPRTAPAPQARKPFGGMMGARMAPQAAQAMQAATPQKPTDIWAKFRK